MFLPPALPPRLALAHLPTPLEPMPRLSAALGLDLRVKRDDLTGSHLSGNKIRKLDFLLADARAQGATHVLTCGGIQSNHARATALAAAPLGMTPVLLLRTPNGSADDLAGSLAPGSELDPTRGLRKQLPAAPTANLLLDRLAGARIVPCTPADYRERRGALLETLAAELRTAGGTPVVIPEGGSNALGALGYATAAWELLAQYDALGLAPPDTCVVATGSGGTLAGLALGFEAAGVPTRAIGVAVCDDRPTFEAIVHRIAAEATDRYGLPRLSPARFEVLDGFQGRGYALTTDDELAFLVTTLRQDGLALDPVYTNKAFRALVATAAAPARPLGTHIAFIHTGGIFGLFAEATALTNAAR